MKVKLKGIKLKNIKKLKNLRFKKDKEVKKEEIKTEEIIEPVQDEEEKEIVEEVEEQPVKEYRETLYSIGHEPKKTSQQPKKDKEIWNLRKREDLPNIEENIDDIGKEKKFKDSSDINKKVDLILSKKKK